MRILEVITLGEIGGAQTVLADIVKGFTDGKRYDVEIDVMTGPGEYLPHLLDQGFEGTVIQTPYLTRKINLFKDFAALFQLMRLCREKKYNLVHCHSSKAAWLGRLAGVFAGVPRICVTVHGVPFRPGISKLARHIYRNIEKLLIPLRAEYVFVSPADMLEMQALGLHPANCKVIPNGRPVPAKPEQGKGLRDLIPVSNEAPIISMIGRLSEQKNPLSCIRVVKKLMEIYPPDLATPYFVLIGDGPLSQETEKAIRQYGLSDYVHLLGPLENASRYLWETDIALLTSNYEACPLVAIEAMATGTPIVASDVGGTGYVVKHGETGYLYSPADEAEAAEYIISLLTDIALRDKMSKKALESYQTNFTVDRMVEEYIDYFGLEKPGVLSS